MSAGSRFTAMVSATLICGCTVWAAGALGKPGSPPEGFDSARLQDDISQSRPGLRVERRQPGQTIVPHQVIVTYRSGTASARRAALRGSVNARLKRRMLVPRTELVEVPAGTDPVATAEKLSGDKDVAAATPNRYLHIATAPNDPSFGQLWGLHNTGQSVNGVAGTADADIDAPEAWSTTTGSQAVTVAVTDTGIAYDHPDLAPNMWSNPGETGGGKETNGVDDDGNGFIDDVHGWDFVDSDNDPRDAHPDGHGTHVAGTIAARGNNGLGVTGVSWRASLMAVRVCDSAGLCPESAIADGFAYAGGESARVANASLAGPAFAGTPAIDAAVRANSATLYVVAAGNSNSDNEAVSLFGNGALYPCNIDADNLVCVTATDSNDNKAGFANYGGNSVDLAAPGVNILSTLPHFETHFSDGFESPLAGRWNTGGQNNRWARTSATKASGSFSLTDSPSGNYLNSTDSYVRTVSPIDLSGGAGCAVRQQLRIDTEYGYDILTVEASTGQSPWVTLVAVTGTSQQQFIPLRVPLPPGEGSLYLGLHLKSNGVNVDDGAYVDDLVAECIPTSGSSSYSGDEYGFLNGTSMASPHVAGAAALVAAAHPADTSSQIKDRLLSSVDPIASMIGGGYTGTVTGGRLNARRAVAESPQGNAVPRVEVEGTRLVVTGSTGDDSITVAQGSGASKLKVIFAGPVQTGPGCSGSGPTFCSSTSAFTSVRVLAGDGDDVVAVTTDVPASIHGGAGSDLLQGPAGAPASIRGGNQTDWIAGGSEADALAGEGGSDAIWGQGGFDRISGGPGNDLLSGGDSGVSSGTADYLRGGDGNDQLSGGAGSDVMYGDRGSDTIRPGPGAVFDQSEGGSFAGIADPGSSDTLNFSDETRPVVAILTNPVVNLGGQPEDFQEDFENITGGKGQDNLGGDSNANRLSGGQQDDWLAGYAGNDTLDGGIGGDYLDGGADNDTVDYRSRTNGVNVTLAANATANDGEPQEGDNLIRVENAVGGRGGDYLQGDSGANTLVGCKGNDFIIGNEGSDLLADAAYGVCSGGDSINIFNALDQEPDGILCGEAPNDFVWVDQGIDSILTPTGPFACESVLVP